jgi:hypothetical protein
MFRRRHRRSPRERVGLAAPCVGVARSAALRSSGERDDDGGTFLVGQALVGHLAARCVRVVRAVSSLLLHRAPDTFSSSDRPIPGQGSSDE